jgi:hypothetical protein
MTLKGRTLASGVLAGLGAAAPALAADLARIKSSGDLGSPETAEYIVKMNGALKALTAKVAGS